MPEKFTDAGWAPKSPDLTAHYAANEPVHPQHQAYRGSISYTSPTSSPPIYGKPALSMPRGVKKESDDDDTYDVDYTPDVSVKSEKAKGKRAKDPNNTGAVAGSTALPGTEHINITVHFPVARIKRIMQADDDVGKVAQVTPVVVCKFLILLSSPIRRFYHPPWSAGCANMEYIQ